MLAVLLGCLRAFYPMRAVTAISDGNRVQLTTDVRSWIKRTAPLVGQEDVEAALQIVRDISAEEDILLLIYFFWLDSLRAANNTILPQGIEACGNCKGGFVRKSCGGSALKSC